MAEQPCIYDESARSTCPVHGKQPAAPAERHVDGSHGPGWDRDWLRSLPDRLPSSTYDEPDLAERARRELDALLADRDRLERDLENARADRQDLWGTRDKRNHRWMEAAERLTKERVAAEAELAETRADLDAALVTIRVLQDELATARRALLDTLALVKADRDRLAADIGVHRRTIDGCHERIAELERVRDLHAERAARLSDDLATARRDAAADALAAIAASYHTGVNATAYDMHHRARKWAAEVREGTRTIPPADRSSDE